MSQNLISKYLFLEQKAQSLEEVLTFLTKAGGPIHIFSESTHIEALIKPCKMMKIKKKSYLYNPTAYDVHFIVNNKYYAMKIQEKSESFPEIPEIP